MNLCGVISFVLCCILQCINIWYWNVYFDDFSAIQTLTWYGTWFCWSTGIFMTYLLFLHRIQTTFSNSTFEPSACTLRSVHVLLTLYAALWLTASAAPLFIFIEDSAFSLSRERVFEIQWTLSGPIAVVDIVLSVSMTWMFVSRLYALILTQTAIHYDETTKPPSRSPTLVHSQSSLRRRTQKMSFLEGTHYQMIRISVKIAILAIVSLTSSLILLAFRTTSFVLSYDTPMAKVAAMWIQMDTMISCVCLVLFLPRTQRGFDALCCCCNVLLSNIMRKLLQHSTVRSLRSIENSRALQISPDSVTADPDADSVAMDTPSSTALRDRDIAPFEIAEQRLKMESSRSPESLKGITPMTSMEILKEMDDFDFTVGGGGTTASKLRYETLEVDHEELAAGSVSVDL